MATSAASRPDRFKKRRVDLPVGRVIAAELAAELLPQKFLGPRRACIVGLPVGLNERPDVARRFFLLRCDEVLVPHLGQHEAAARERAVVVPPGRERRRRSNQARHERRFGQGQDLGRLAEQMLRHRVDAVNARAQVHTIEIQLEDLLFSELRFDEQRNCCFFRLASVRSDV